MNGKIYEYNSFERLEFEGEYKNGEKNGYGKEYQYGTRLLFEGEYINGKRSKGNKIIMI